MKTLGTFTLAATLALTSFFATAQDKHENHYKVPEAISTKGYTVEVVNAHSQMQFSKVKVKITNTTSDYLVVETKEIVFEIGGEKYSPKGKTIVINPRKSTTKILTVDGGDKFHVSEYKLNLDGFYSLPKDKEELKAENFALPANKNSFDVGGFECKVAGDIVKVTKVTEVPFKCTYNGDHVGILDESNTVVKLESGQEYVTTSGKSKLQAIKGKTNVLFPGDSKKFVAEFKVPGKVTDMQFANMEIVWKGTFVESKKLKLGGGTMDFVLDPGLTEGKNK